VCGSPEETSGGGHNLIPVEITMGVGVLKVVIFTTMIIYNLEGFFEPENIRPLTSLGRDSAHQ
jgi:hypothetical protein